MNQSTMTDGACQSTPRAILVALGLKVQQLDLFRPIREQVHIQQQTVRYTPTDKLYDAWVAILAGAHGLVEVNTRLRSGPALQAAFGRTGCAEQSVIQDTLDACDATIVQQMELEAGREAAGARRVSRQWGGGARCGWSHSTDCVESGALLCPSVPRRAPSPGRHGARCH